MFSAIKSSCYSECDKILSLTIREVRLAKTFHLSMNKFLANFLETNLSGSRDLTINHIITQEYDYQLYPLKKVKRQDCLVLVNSDGIAQFAALVSLYKDEIIRIYLEKIDSSGYHPVKGLPSQTVLGILEYFSKCYDKIRMHVYCATSTQLLFTNSSETGKTIHSDRALVRWWLRCTAKSNAKARFFYIPGETVSSTKRIVPDGFVWGLGVDPNSNAHALPIFPDDLVKKSLEYIDPNGKVKDLLELMDCMESAAGMRALITLDLECMPAFTASNGIELKLWYSFMDAFGNLEFGTEKQAKDSTTKLDNLVKSLDVESACDCTLLPASAAPIGEENQNPVTAQVAQSKTNAETTVNSVQGFVKRKPQVTNVANLVKKKKKLV